MKTKTIHIHTSIRSPERMKTLLEALKKKNACQKAIDWLQTQSSPEEAWRTCEHGDWMLWHLKYAKKLDAKKIVKIACECARLALPYVKEGEGRPLHAIELAERWANGEAITQSELEAAYAAAYAAYAAHAVAADAAVLKQCSDIVRKYFPEAPGVSEN